MQISLRGAINLIGFGLGIFAFFWILGYVSTKPPPAGAAAAVADGIRALFGFIFSVFEHVL